MTASEVRLVPSKGRQTSSAFAAVSGRLSAMTFWPGMLVAVVLPLNCAVPFSASRAQAEQKPLTVLSAERFQPKASRSEEHTSELQSLMRISYAVFCLKKKKTTYHITNKSLTTQK